MKLIIQIPCYNEAETLEVALNDLRRNWGVHYVVNFKCNKGLAKGLWQA